MSYESGEKVKEIKNTKVNYQYEIFENDAGEAVHFAQNVYNANAWKISPYAVVTDVMPNTFCRAPGSTQV